MSPAQRLALGLNSEASPQPRPWSRSCGAGCPPGQSGHSSPVASLIPFCPLQDTPHGQRPGQEGGSWPGPGRGCVSVSASESQFAPAAAPAPQHHVVLQVWVLDCCFFLLQEKRTRFAEKFLQRENTHRWLLEPASCLFGCPLRNFFAVGPSVTCGNFQRVGPHRAPRLWAGAEPEPRPLYPEAHSKGSPRFNHLYSSSSPAPASELLSCGEKSPRPVDGTARGTAPAGSAGP